MSQRQSAKEVPPRPKVKPAKKDPDKAALRELAMLRRDRNRVPFLCRHI